MTVDPASLALLRALDGEGIGQAHVAGYTFSQNFPTAHAYQPTFGGGYVDAFVATVNSSGIVDVQTGVLALVGNGASSSAGQFSVGASARLDLATGQAFTFNTGANSVGAGAMRIATMSG